MPPSSPTGSTFVWFSSQFGCFFFRCIYLVMYYMCTNVYQSKSGYRSSWESKGTPPMPPPPGNKALLRPYWGRMVVNSPLIRPYFLGGGGIGGVPLGFHDRYRTKQAFRNWMTNNGTWHIFLTPVATSTYLVRFFQCILQLQT